MNVKDILEAKGHAVFSISPGATLAEVVRELVDRNCGSLLVMEGEKTVGIITERDILRTCAQDRRPLSEISVRERMTREPVTASPSDNLNDVMGLMTSRRIRHLPIMDGSRLVGMVSIGDVVKAQHDGLHLENEMLKDYIQR